MAAHAPTEVVAVVFTDVEDSSGHWERLQDGFRRVLEEHDSIVRDALAETRGYEVKHAGDAFMLVFQLPSDAVAFAVRAQCALLAHSWPEEVGQLLVRIGVHTGQPITSRDARGHPEYVGPVVNRAARVADAGHGGQVLLSAATLDLVRNQLPPGARAIPLGSHRLRGLEQPEELHQLDHTSWPHKQFPPLRTLDQHTHNLPVHLTSFVGRDKELSHLSAMLRGAGIRLITVLGPGGAGKTRLALQAAAECVEEFADGVWFVELAEVQDADSVPEKIATTLGLRGENPASEVTEYLSRRQVLLVLDSFEHIRGAASFVTQLLRAAPGVTCLATSRSLLRASGENVFEVPPMPVPDAHAPAEQMASCDSMSLLVERARAQRVDFELTADNVAAAAALCTKLEGIPLAIEIAASRLGRMTASEVLDRLSQRASILESRLPDLPTRQRTLRAAIESSHELLSSELRTLFAQLSVFRGGFFMAAAEQVCEGVDVLEGVLDLCDHSLVSSRELNERTRYLLLELVREFAREQLGSDEHAELCARHAEHFRDRVARLALHVDRASEPEVFGEIEADLDNIRAGMDWAESRGDDRMVAEYAAGLADFLWRRGHWRELLLRMEAGLAAVGSLGSPDPQLLIRLLYIQTAVAQDRGGIETASRAGERGLAVAREHEQPDNVVLFLNLQALRMRTAGQAEHARYLAEEGLELARENDFARGEGMVLHNLGLLAYDTRDVETSRCLYRQALRLRREAGDQRGAAETLNNLAVLAEEEGHLEEAGRFYREALASYFGLQDLFGTAVSLCNLAEVAQKTGDLALAAQLLAPAARALSELGSVHAEHARALLQRVQENGGLHEGAHEVPWRRALLSSAEGVLAGVTR